MKIKNLGPSSGFRASVLNQDQSPAQDSVPLCLRVESKSSPAQDSVPPCHN